MGRPKSKKIERVDDASMVESKSARKRAHIELQELARAISELSKKQLYTIEVPTAWMEEIDLIRSMPDRGAKVRQIRYFAKLLEDNLQLTDQLRTLITSTEAAHNADSQAFHAIEIWRDRLIQEGNAALTEFTTTYPVVDSAQLQTLVHQAKQEANAANKAASRKLFRFLRESIESAYI